MQKLKKRSRTSSKTLKHLTQIKEETWVLENNFFGESCFGAPQVALVVKNPLAEAGDRRDLSSLPGSGRSPEGENGYPLQHS